MLVRFNRGTIIKGLVKQVYLKSFTKQRNGLASNFRFCQFQQSSKNGAKKQKEQSVTKNGGQKRIDTNSIVQKAASQSLVGYTEEDKQYQLVERRYNEKNVPGLQERKYSNLNSLQEQIIGSNKFDLFNPELTPKTGSVSSFPGLVDPITEISLGNVKIKGKNEVFLSEIDLNNIPEDLYVRFDQQKELKVVGKETLKQKDKDDRNLEQPKQKQIQMKILNETIEQKTMKDHFENEFGFGMKSYKYSNWKSINRVDIFLTVLFLVILSPVQTTLIQVHQCYKTTKAIEDERMKQIQSLKKRSYQKALLQNKDFKLIV